MTCLKQQVQRILACPLPAALISTIQSSEQDLFQLESAFLTKNAQIQQLHANLKEELSHLQAVIIENNTLKAALKSTKQTITDLKLYFKQCQRQWSKQLQNEKEAMKDSIVFFAHQIEVQIKKRLPTPPLIISKEHKGFQCSLQEDIKATTILKAELMKLKEDHEQLARAYQQAKADLQLKDYEISRLVLLARSEDQIIQDGLSRILTPQTECRSTDLTKAHYPQGFRYEGETQNGIRQGFGFLYYESRLIYRGRWKGGLFDGRGFLGWLPSQHILSYEGHFKGGSMHGFGTITYNSGHRVVSRWNCHKIEGESLLQQGQEFVLCQLTTNEVLDSQDLSTYGHP